ncbi:MAG: hypothetical protein JST50_15045 [Bacteroidetes bacterium]|jgi:hypothetical protein|nr:hypothetical protein [Bacteroidota bacterium]
MSNQEQIKLIADYLLKKWYLLLAGLIIGVLIGLVIFLRKPPVYSSSISFVLSTDSRPNTGIVNIASQLGFDGITSNPDNIFSGENIIELFKSRKLISAALLSEADTAKHVTLLNLIAQKQFPQKYASAGSFGKNPDKFSTAQRDLYRQIITRTGSSFTVFKKDKKLIIYIITATSTDPDIAYHTSKLVLDQTSRYFIETKTKISATSVRLLQHEADSLAGVLSRVYSSTASMSDQTFNLNPAFSVQRSGMMFNQAKAAAFAAAYAEVMRNLEIAKINLQKETPLYRVIDDPELPLLPIRQNLIKYLFISSCVGLFLIAVLLSALQLKTQHRNNPVNS